MSEGQEKIRTLHIEEPAEKNWRGGVYLCTATNSFEADIFESKLRGENIPCLKRHKGAGNYLEVFMGTDAAYSIDIYVPEEVAAKPMERTPLESSPPVWPMVTAAVALQ